MCTILSADYRVEDVCCLFFVHPCPLFGRVVVFLCMHPPQDTLTLCDISFGENKVPRKDPATFWELIVESLDDFMVRIIFTHKYTCTRTRTSLVSMFNVIGPKKQ